jgi:hypothetical protein
MQWDYTTLHYTTLRRTTRYNKHVQSECDPYWSYTSSQMFIYILQTKYKQLRASIWSGSLSYNFGVTAVWVHICQPGVLQNFSISIYWWRQWGSATALCKTFLLRMLNDSCAGRNPTKGCSADWRREEEVTSYQLYVTSNNFEIYHGYYKIWS